MKNPDLGGRSMKVSTIVLNLGLDTGGLDPHDPDTRTGNIFTIGVCGIYKDIGGK